LKVWLFFPRKHTIVALHGHGATGVELLFDAGGSERAIASELAAAGFTVIAIETRSFGESRVGDLSHFAYVQRLRLQGREFHGEVLADNSAVLTWAASRGVDLDELGVVGHSMGGVGALFLATSDSRIDAALMSGSSGSWRHSFSSVEHCSCSVIAGLLTRIDWLPLVAASHASVVAIEGGARDEILGLSNVGDELAAYRTLDRLGGPRTVVLRHEGSHEHDPQQVVEFFRQAFSLQASSESTTPAMR
jgi:pimeloyl-ACP methyl ester carboxylesterase